MNAKQIVSGVVVLVFTMVMGAPAQAQVMQRHRSDRYSDHRGGHYHAGGAHYHRGGGLVFDGGMFLGIVGLGILLNELAEARTPVVVYEPPPGPYRWYAAPGQYQSSGPDRWYAPYDSPGYPPPKRYYPECKEFLGNPGAMAFCEKGVLERENEEQKRIEQRAYEAGRGQ